MIFLQKHCQKCYWPTKTSGIDTAGSACKLVSDNHSSSHCIECIDLYPYHFIFPSGARREDMEICGREVWLLCTADLPEIVLGTQVQSVSRIQTNKSRCLFFSHFWRFLKRSSFFLKQLGQLQKWLEPKTITKCCLLVKLTFYLSIDLNSKTHYPESKLQHSHAKIVVKDMGKNGREFWLSESKLVLMALLVTQINHLDIKIVGLDMWH